MMKQGEMKQVTIEHRTDRVPLYSAELPDGWSVARLNRGLRNHLRARRRAATDPSDLQKLSAGSLIVGEIFG